MFINACALVCVCENVCVCIVEKDNAEFWGAEVEGGYTAVFEDYLYGNL